MTLQYRLWDLPEIICQIAEVEVKSLWKLLGSSKLNGANEEFAVDGILQPPTGITNVFSSQLKDHPWFRIMLTTQHIIQGARIIVRAKLAHRIAYTEVDTY